MFKESRTDFNHHTKKRMTEKPEMISGVFRTNIYLHHGHPRFIVYVPKERSFPIPLKNIDVVRRTNKGSHALEIRRGRGSLSQMEQLSWQEQIRFFEKSHLKSGSPLHEERSQRCF